MSKGGGMEMVLVLNCGILKILKMVLTAALFGAGHKKLKYTLTPKIYLLSTFFFSRFFRIQYDFTLHLPTLNRKYK